MMKQLTIGAVGVVVGVLISLGLASAADRDDPKMSERSEPQDFMMEAARGGLAEVTLGQMAAQRASRDEVKQFGQRMVQDHGKANTELMQLAATKGVTLPKELDSTHKAMAERLSQLSGAEFDRAYMSEMVKDHTKDVSAFQHQAGQGTDPEVKNWAAKTLPTLQQHLEMAQDTAQKVGAIQKSAERQ
jgi:putative membrane protein